MPGGGGGLSRLEENTVSSRGRSTGPDLMAECGVLMDSPRGASLPSAKASARRFSLPLTPSPHHPSTSSELLSPIHRQRNAILQRSPCLEDTQIGTKANQRLRYFRTDSRQHYLRPQ